MICCWKASTITPFYLVATCLFLLNKMMKCSRRPWKPWKLWALLTRSRHVRIVINTVFKIYICKWHYIDMQMHEVNSVQNNHFAKLICVYERKYFSLVLPTYPKRDYWVQASSINSNDHLKPFFRTFQQLAWKICKIIWFIFERNGTGSNSSYVLTFQRKEKSNQRAWNNN